MTRLIDADALSDLLVKTYEKAPTEKALLFVSLLLKNNEQVPTIEYTFEEAYQKTVCENKLYCPSRPHGKWIKQEWGYSCSVCGVSNDYAYDNNIHKFTDYFCPNCGAKMDQIDGGVDDDK